MRSQQSLFENIRMTLDDAIEMTVFSMEEYANRYNHWSISFSGGKDSSATLAIVLWLIETGKIKKPESLTVLYADTGLELLPLHASALKILDAVGHRGYSVKIVKPDLDKRFFVYMFGRGVPPPSNVFRWCTGSLKIKPMMDALSILREETQEKFLSLIGVRLGESAARDQRIAIACGNDAECGQGYYQETTPANVADVMAPIVHWRTCHVWDLLQGFGPDHKLPTTEIAEIYGIGTELEEVSSRTGCTACNLASRDVALDRIIRLPKWSYLQPLKELKPLYAELKKPYRRLRKTKGERNSSGDLVSNLHRLGPMTMETRLWGLNQILSIQKRINLEAIKTNMPEISLINPIEHNRILELIDLNTWPDKWSGEEETGDVLHDQVIAEGVVQPLIFENDWK